MWTNCCKLRQHVTTSIDLAIHRSIDLSIYLSLSQHVTTCYNILHKMLQHVATRAHLQQNHTKCREMWSFCESPFCPDPVWKPRTGRILPPSEIGLGLFWADFTDLEGKHLFHRIGWKGRIWQVWAWCSQHAAAGSAAGGEQRHGCSPYGTHMRNLLSWLRLGWPKIARLHKQLA